MTTKKPEKSLKKKSERGSTANQNMNTTVVMLKV
jgi:hypothetical protein